jgi:hypothetical protein
VKERAGDSRGRKFAHADAYRAGSVWKKSLKRTVNVRFGEFTLHALAGEGELAIAQGRSRAVRALRFYLRDGDSDSANWPCPGFLPDVEGHGGVGLELTVDDDLWCSLESEAERQGVSPTQLAEHAVLYFFANWDAGRIAQLLLDDLGD